MMLLFVLTVIKSASGLSLIEIRNTWITILLSLTGITILLSTVGIKVPIMQIFVTNSLRAVAYIFKGIIRLIGFIPKWISGAFKALRSFFKSLGMSERLSNVIAIIIIIAII